MVSFAESDDNGATDRVRVGCSAECACCKSSRKRATEKYRNRVPTLQTRTWWPRVPGGFRMWEPRLPNPQPRRRAPPAPFLNKPNPPRPPTPESEPPPTCYSSGGRFSFSLSLVACPFAAATRSVSPGSIDQSPPWKQSNGAGARASIFFKAYVKTSATFKPAGLLLRHRSFF